LDDNCLSPESLLIQKADIAAIRDAIEKLPFHYREVVLLCDVEDLTYREIAQVIEIPMGTVMSRLARARKVIRDSLRSTHIDSHRQTVSA
jgi:RNA polymerase sigma-70 factor (ECF subfamily)